MRFGAYGEQRPLKNGPAPGLSARNKPKNGLLLSLKAFLDYLQCAHYARPLLE
jgi:hypothetical protein